MKKLIGCVVASLLIVAVLSPISASARRGRGAPPNPYPGDFSKWDTRSKLLWTLASERQLGGDNHLQVCDLYEKLPVWERKDKLIETLISRNIKNLKEVFLAVKEKVYAEYYFDILRRYEKLGRPDVDTGALLLERGLAQVR